MTQTPVATVWEPHLASRSLPGGLPFLGDDETPISEDSARVLSRRSSDAVPFGDAWLLRPTSSMSERFLRTPADEPRGPFGRMVRYEVLPTGIVSTMLMPAETGRAIHEAISELKERLGIDLETLIDLIGMRRRTYYTHRKLGMLPAARLPDIQARVTVLRGMVEESVAAAQTLLASRREELVDRFANADYRGARRLFDDVRGQLDAARPTGLRFDLGALRGNIDEVAAVVEEPAFEAAATTFAWLRRMGTDTMDRIRAVVEAEQAVKGAHEGSEVNEAWDFLVTMTHDDMDSVLERARGLATSEEFDRNAWDAFVSAEAERAWARYAPTILPPDPVEPLDIPDEAAPLLMPDLSGFGVAPTYAERVR